MAIIECSTSIILNDFIFTSIYYYLGVNFLFLHFSFQFMRKILSLINTKNVLEKIARECNNLDKYQLMNDNLRDLLESCLSISPKDRPLPNVILENELFMNDTEKFVYKKGSLPEMLLLRCPLRQIYYWWQLAGGDVHVELKAEGLIRNEAPILSMPK